MVVTCANLECKRRFSDLQSGRLFLLLPPGDKNGDASDAVHLIEHCHWLCCQCVGKFTIELDGRTPVVSTLVPRRRMGVA